MRPGREPLPPSKCPCSALSPQPLSWSPLWRRGWNAWWSLTSKPCLPYASGTRSAPSPACHIRAVLALMRPKLQQIALGNHPLQPLPILHRHCGMPAGKERIRFLHTGRSLEHHRICSVSTCLPLKTEARRHPPEGRGSAAQPLFYRIFIRLPVFLRHVYAPLDTLGVRDSSGIVLVSLGRQGCAAQYNCP